MSDLKLLDQLPALPKGFSCARLIVISPFVQKAFCAKLRERYRPKRSRLIVDTSTPVEAARECREALGPKACVALMAQSAGLMHAKLYFMEHAHPEKQTRRYLAWGSANATSRGFGPNGETLSVLRLRSRRDAPLLEYFDALWSCDGKTRDDVFLEAPHQSEEFSDLTLSLPAMTIEALRPEAANTSLDAWLQSGWLCHKYAPAQTFGKFRVVLQKPLPKGDLDSLLAKLALVSEGESKVLRLPYLPFVVGSEVREATDEGTAPPKWRSRYFVETYLGHWCSDACNRKWGEKFSLLRTELRQQQSDALRALDGRPRELAASSKRAVGELRDRLMQATNLVRQAGEDPAEFFGDDTTEFVARACQAADKRVRADVQRISNDVFQDIFVRGITTEPMPRFMADSGSWDEFRIAWANGLILEGDKTRTDSALWRRLRDQFDDEDADELTSAESLLEHLDDEGVGVLADYYLDEEDE